MFFLAGYAQKQHILNIVDLSQAELLETYETRRIVYSNCYFFMKINLWKTKAHQNTSDFVDYNYL